MFKLCYNRSLATMLEQTSTFCYKSTTLCYLLSINPMEPCVLLISETSMKHTLVLKIY